jgi:PAS domain S-box-containing protein
MDATTITTLIIAVLGSGGVGALITKYWESRRQDNGQSHSQYMELFEKQNIRIAVLEKEVDDCHEDKARLYGELGAVREAVHRLEASNVLAVITSDDDGKICGWSHGATTLFGWTQDEAKGQSVEIVIPERIRSRHHEAFQAALKRGVGEPLAAIQMRDSWGLKRDGSEIPITILLRGWESGGNRFFSADIQRRS